MIWFPIWFKRICLILFAKFIKSLEHLPVSESTYINFPQVPQDLRFLGRPTFDRNYIIRNHQSFLSFMSLSEDNYLDFMPQMADFG